MLDRNFFFGLIVGLAAVYVYHRVRGIPTNAPGGYKGA